MKNWIRIFAVWTVLTPVVAVAQSPGIVNTNINGAGYVESSLVDRGSVRAFRVQSTNTGTKQFLFAEANGDYSPKWSGSDVNWVRNVNTYYPASGGNGTYVSFSGNQGWTKDHDVTVSNGNYYTIIVGELSGVNNDLSILETSYLPQDISAVSDASSGVISSYESVTVTVTMAGALSSGEKLFVRYTTNAWSSSNFVEITELNGSFEGTAVIPGQASGTAVSYYALTSNTTPTHSNADYMTLNFRGEGLQNVANNYDYTVVGWTTAQAGNWSTAATWTANAVPSTSENLGAVSIGHDVTLDQAASVGSLTITAGTFTASDASARTLTVVKSTSGSATTINNSAGTWANGTGGSTVVLTGAPSAGDAVHSVSGTIGFNNITVNKTGGSNNVGASFTSGSTVAGTLQIGAGGYIASAPPTGFYESSAILAFNQGESAEYEVGVTDDSWSTTQVPQSITISSGTVTLNEARTVSTTLIVSNGATLVSAGNLTISSGGRLLNSGTITGNMTFQRLLTGSAGWRAFSTPFASKTYGDLLGTLWTQGFTGADSPSNGESNVKVWNGSAFVSIADQAGEMTPGRGFITYVFDDVNYTAEGGTGFPKTISLSGAENAGPVTPTLQNTANGGWNLVGNPFGATIDWDGLSKADLSGTVYVYDPAYGSVSAPDQTNETGGGWRVWNGSAGSLTDGLIAPFQGFFVQNSATSPSISFAQANKTLGGSFRGKTESVQLIELLARGEGFSSSAFFVSGEANADLGFDGKDAWKLYPLDTRYALLASVLEDGRLLDINNLPRISNRMAIPVSFDATKSGRYTLSVPAFSFGNDVKVTLVDRETGVSMVVNAEFSYAFNFTAGAEKAKSPLDISRPTIAQANDPRFELVLEPKTTSNEVRALPTAIALEQNYPNPFNPTTAVSFSLPMQTNVKLSVFDVNGRQIDVISQGVKAAGKHTVSWNAAGRASGVYMLRLEAGGQILTRKMTLLK